MDSRNMQKAALFMICLMVSLPFYSANTFAAINAYSTSSKGARDYRAVNDQSTIFAEITGTGAVASQVRLVTNQDVGFQQCISNESSQTSLCTYRMSQGSSPIGTFPYSVAYQGQTGVNSITVDSLEPNVTISSITISQNITASISVRERAYDPADTNKCSGIKSIDYVLAGNVLKTVLVNQQPGVSCANSVFTESVPSASTNNIEKSFCVVVTDNVGNVGEACQNIVVDKELPIPSNAVATTLQGTPINYVSSSTGSISAVIMFSLRERSLLSVRADASEFSSNQAQKDQMRNLVGSCSNISCNGDCSCTIPNVIVNLPQGGSPSLRVTATDTSGNVADVSIPVSIRVDNNAPIVSSLVAKQCAGVNTLGSGVNTITATIQESESGIVGKKVYLDLSSLDSAYSRVFPNSCAQSGSSWKCTWGPFAASSSVAHGSNIPISIVSPSQDDAGNFFAYSTNLFYDSENPVVIGSSLRAASNVAFGNEITNFPTTGGTVQISLFVKDNTPVTISADLSGISPIQRKNATCSTVAGNQTCVLSEIGPLFGPQDTTIPITVTDCVGNSETINLPISISNLDTQSLDYFTYSVSQTGPAIDKQVLSVIPQKAYFPLSSISLQGSTPIVQKITACEPASALNYFEVSKISNSRMPDLIGSPSTTPYVRFNLDRQTDPPSPLAVTCTVQTISRSFAGSISQPELDNVSFSIAFANTRFGAIDDSVKNKAKEVRDSALVQGKLIGDMEKIVSYARTACGIWNTYVTIMNIIAFIDAIMGAIGKTGFGAAAEKAFTALTQANAAGTVAAGKLIKPFCDFVSCNSLAGGLISDGKVAGAYTEFLNTWATLGSSLVDSATISNKYEPERTTQGQGQRGDAATTPPTVPTTAPATTTTTGTVTPPPAPTPAGTPAPAPSKSTSTQLKFDPKDSIIFSAASLCLPGILYNLQKARQIECTYVYCLENQVSKGVPTYYCEVLRASAWCKFVWGELFQVIPFARFIDGMLDLFKKAFTDPVFIASLAISLCAAKLSDGIIHSACILTQGVVQLVDAVKSIFDFFNNWSTAFQPTTDMCAVIQGGT